MAAPFSHTPAGGRPAAFAHRLPRLLVAATHSGAGKTTVAMGLAAAWSRQGKVVQAFKVGPDYIDPTHLAAATGRPARNLDSWLLPPRHLPALVARACRGADVAVVEGVMGLFDGLGYHDDTASSAEVARILRLPVVLVVDASGSARSAAACALGFVRFAPDLAWAGVVVNRVAGPSHGRGVAQAIREATGLPVFGWLPSDPSVTVPERHLGLVPAGELAAARAEEGNTERAATKPASAPGPGTAADRAARLVESHLDLDGLWQAARQAPPLELAEGLPGTAEALPDPAHGLPVGESPPPALRQPPTPAPRPVVAVARDAAFSFHYPENLELLGQAGARLRFFRPAEGEGIPPGADGLFLSGGFPELHTRRLAENDGFLEGIRAMFRAGRPIYAECGGLMVLTQAIVADGRRWPMAGVLPGEAVMGEGLRIGYRQARACADGWLLRQGEQVRGHEFHRSRWRGRPDGLPPALEWEEGGALRRDGAAVGSLWASYVHLHFLSCPELARRFVQACARSAAGCREEATP